MILAPEYPSLTAEEIAEGASKRLAKSKRRFDASRVPVPILSGDLMHVLGDLDGHERSSSSAINEWMGGWVMPVSPENRPDVQTSRGVYVGVEDSFEMPSADMPPQGVPYITVTSGFVDLCWRLSEIYPVFASIAKSRLSAEQANGMREILFDHLDLHSTRNPLTSEFIDGHRDQVFSERSTAAAVRWAIGHEMAHAVGTRQERADAFKRAQELFPRMESVEWLPKKRSSEIEDFNTSVARYKDEIACDLLASRYVLESAFSADDLVTQVCGSLLALEALIFDGFKIDGSLVSQTHPSPSLRFQIVLMDWMETLCDESTWQGRDSPGLFGLQDVAYWTAFERWAAGHYGPHRAGARWQEDIDLAMGLLQEGVPMSKEEQIYVREGSGLARAPRGR